MELNERIFEQRRKAGMSQEELAEKLGVSRQAVGKWENGTSTPDINNLIELSKVFGLSLTELLGIQEPPHTADGDKARSELEEFLKHYAYEQSQQAERYEEALREHEEQEASRRKIQNIMLCIFAVVLLALGIVASKRISRLNVRLNNLDSNTRNSISDLSYDIYDMQSSITELLKAQASLFSDTDIDLTDYNAADGTVTVSISVTPKSMSDGMQAEFVLTNLGDNTEFRCGAERGGTTFSAFIQVPSGEYEITALITDNGTQMSEELGRYSGSPIGLAAEYYFDWLHGPDYASLADENGSRYRSCGLFALWCNQSEWPARGVDSIELVLYKNETEYSRISMDVDDPTLWVVDYVIPEEYLFVTAAGTESSVSGTVESAVTKPTGYSAAENGMLFVSEFDFGEVEAAVGDEMRIELIVTDKLGLVYRQSEFDLLYFNSSTSTSGSSSAGHLSLDYELYK